MRSLIRLVARLGNFMTGRRSDERLSEEIELHLAAQTTDNISAGMTPEEARRQARLKFGAVGATREAYHAEEGMPLMENLLLDIRYALRVLRKSPGFTVVALVTLMLGIGANVVVFGVLNAILLKPLAVSEPESLYQIRHKPWMSFRLLTTSYPAFEDFRQRNTTFSGMAGVNGYSHAVLRWQNAVRKVHGNEVTGNYFDLLGVRPELGRFFHAADERGTNSAPYVVLSDDLWRSAFQANRAVIGMTVQLNKHPFTVVGVAPEQFHGTERFVWPDYWIPIVNEEQVEGSNYLHSRTSVALTVLGRLKPRVTPEQATENLNAIAAALGNEYPQTDDGQSLRLIHPGLFGDEGEVIRGFLYSVTALSLLLLGAACTNLARLFAARASDRSRELALRMALGSSRRRLVRQILIETVLVSLMGGAAGLVTAELLLILLNRWHSPYGPLMINVDARVYLTGFALTMASALLSGIVPARQAWHSSPIQIMKRGSADAMHLRRFALRDLLLGAQIAVCTLLVTASLVAVRGMVQALHTPLGFKPHGAMLAELDLSEASDLTRDKRKELLEAALRIPGVAAAGAVSRVPMTGGLRGVPVYRPGTTEFKLKNSVLSPYVFSMSPGYLEVAGTRLVDGRDVSWRDTRKPSHVAIVNKTFARKMWGLTPALGRRFILWGELREVVGVSEDGKYHDITESPQPAVYVPFLQSDQDETVFLVRSLRAPNELTAALERTLSGIEPNVPIKVQSWSNTLNGELLPAQAATVALGVMGLLASMLAVTGIAGVAAYNVSRRIKELGIRVALGASKTQVMSAAVGRPIVLLGAGSALGLLAGIFASSLLGKIVYRANPLDPAVIGGAVLTMALLGIVASAFPVRRALAIDPSKLMREE